MTAPPKPPPPAVDAIDAEAAALDAEEARIFAPLDAFIASERNANAQFVARLAAAKPTPVSSAGAQTYHFTGMTPPRDPGAPPRPTPAHAKALADLAEIGARVTALSRGLAASEREVTRMAEANAAALAAHAAATARATQAEAMLREWVSGDYVDCCARRTRDERDGKGGFVHDAACTWVRTWRLLGGHEPTVSP